MSKITAAFKLASTAVATTAALLTVVRENPQLAAGVQAAIDKVKNATARDKPKLRLEAKLKAIVAAADAVEHLDPASPDPKQWRHQVGALRVRADLAWHASSGRARGRAMKLLTAETTDLLDQVNATLAQLQASSLDEIDPA